MLGSSPSGQDFDTTAYAATLGILQSAVTSFVGKDYKPPSRLHHYTSLATAQKILACDDIRLYHAEYSNDQMEMIQAREAISRKLKAANSKFLAEVLGQYENIATNLDAYIFCMSEGEDGVALPQDRLSQWRAYGHDGRGICISLSWKKLGD